MGHPDFRVGGRIFATIHPDPKWGMVNLTPEQQRQFVADAPDSFVPESGAWDFKAPPQCVCNRSTKRPSVKR